jgi:hypothetical protein
LKHNCGGKITPKELQPIIGFAFPLQKTAAAE